MKTRIQPKHYIIGGCVFVIVSVALGWFLFPFAIDQLTIHEMQLVSGKEIFEVWREFPFPLLFTVIIWNVTNAQDIMEKGAKPKVVETGKYVYEERRFRTHIKEYPEKGTIKYVPEAKYTFRQDLSNGLSESDLVTVINVPYVSVSAFVKELPTLMRSAMKEHIREFGEKPFVTKTVVELLFRGWHVPLLESIQNLSGFSIVPNATFSMFFGRNETGMDGEFEIYSGTQGYENFGKIISWKGKKELDYWFGSRCNKINGSDGTMHPPFVTRDRVIDVFGPEVCRSMYMTYVKDVTISKIITAYRFAVPPEAFDGTHPENECFCPRDSMTGELECTRKGTFTLRSCQYGAPGIISEPHFLHGDDDLIKQFEMKPSEELHNTYLDIEPLTSFTLEARRTVQVNMDTSGLKEFPGFKKVPATIFPVLWISETADISEDDLLTFKMRVIYPLLALSYGRIILVVVGCVVIAIGIFKRYQMQKVRCFETSHYLKVNLQQKKGLILNQIDGNTQRNVDRKNESLKKDRLQLLISNP